MDKKTELELKKARLEEIRKKKAAAAAAVGTIGGSDSASSPSGGAETSNQERLEVNPDKILIECGITTPVLFSNNSSGVEPSNDANSQHHSIPGQSKSMLKNKKKVSLSKNQVNTIDIPPRENVTYSKETQTPATDVIIDKDAKPLDYYVLTYDNIDEDETASIGSASTQTTTQTHKSSKKRNHMTSTSSVNDDKLDQHLNDELKHIDDRVKSSQIKEISEEERQHLLESDDFVSFFMRNSRILEKALDQDDIFFEYGANDKNSDMVETGQAFKLHYEFLDEKLRNRIVTWMDWSPQYPELLLASYEDSSLDPDGLALVWNTKFKSTSPEFTFNCSSWVTSCCFARFHPNLVIGGTYSGQIVMWDNRSNKRTPIQRSSLSASSHTHPIYCVQVVGSQNAHNLISISNDGKLCSWTLDNMNTPQESLELQCKQNKQVAITSMGFRAGDTNNFVVGSEEGPVYLANRHGNKSGISESFEGHYGPVTGLSCHHVQGPIDFSNLFLTSSFDWTIKLWNLKEPGRPLYSFERNSDYVYDVQWSPVNPALFACVDGTGRLDLWNLINDTEVPTASIMLNGSPALNKIRWSQNGHQIAVCDDQGRITLYDVNEAFANPRPDDWNRLVRVLQDLKQNSAEMDSELAGGSTNSNSTTNTPILTSNSSSNLLQTPITANLNSVKSEPNFEYRSPPLITQTIMNQLKQSPQTPK